MAEEWIEGFGTLQATFSYITKETPAVKEECRIPTDAKEYAGDEAEAWLRGAPYARKWDIRQAYVDELYSAIGEIAVLESERKAKAYVDKMREMESWIRAATLGKFIKRSELEKVKETVPPEEAKLLESVFGELTS